MMTLNIRACLCCRHGSYLHHVTTLLHVANIISNYSNMPPKRSTRAAKKVKIDTAATENEIDAALRSGDGDTFEGVFGTFPDPTTTDDVSDASDYAGRKRKEPVNHVKHDIGKKTKRPFKRLTLARQSATDAPQADPMSDNDYDSAPDMGSGSNWLKSRTPPKPARMEGHDAETPAMSAAVAKQDRSTPQILQIHVSAGAENGGSTINLDLSSLLHAYNDGTVLSVNPNNDDTLVGDEDSTIPVSPSTLPPSLRLQRLSDAKVRGTARKLAKASFTDLPGEIRVRIYRSVFVTQAPISFHTRSGFQRSSNLLRTCKTVLEEGRAVLYGENAFHFERSHCARGRYFEYEWHEIGFKDVRRFLETIGNTNISMMRYLSFEFSDATRAYGPEGEVHRRFVNDPVVWRCLELIGSNTHLLKFAFTFAGRRNLDRPDLHFLRALTSIKSQEVTNVTNWGGGYKAKADLVADLKKLMVVPRDDPEEVDENKKKAPTVIMRHERNRMNRYYNEEWS
jgi:hypothetical protein